MSTVASLPTRPSWSWKNNASLSAPGYTPGTPPRCRSRVTSWPGEWLVGPSSWCAARMAWCGSCSTPAPTAAPVSVWSHGATVRPFSVFIMPGRLTITASLLACRERMPTARRLTARPWDWPHRHGWKITAALSFSASIRLLSIWSTTWPGRGTTWIWYATSPTWHGDCRWHAAL